VAGKRYRTASQTIDRSRAYPLAEAVGLLKTFPPVKFDESVDLAINLGVDPKHADQMVRGTISLPHGIGKSTRVLVFAKNEKEKEAREAGADFVGAEDLAKKIQDENWF
jgi:large subunit ribosomal protein L1